MNKPYTGGKIDVSVVIPAHNEEANVGPLLEQFNELSKRVRFGFEVIVVDDGSTDRTRARLVDAQRVHRFLRVVAVPYRRGLTEALQAGFGIAQGAIVVFYPADRQFHPNDIPKMIDKVREGYDLVTGRKIGLYNKRVVSGLYSRLSRWLFPSISVTDLNSVKAFRREMIDVFDYRHDWHRFWVAIVAEQGYRVAEVDVTLYPRPAGRSKFGFLRIPSGVLDLMAVKFQYHTLRRPLWYFGMTGSFLLLIGLLLGLLALYQRFVLKNAFRPLLYLVMMLGISGVVFFTLGFLAEAVAGIRQQLDSLRGRPKFRLYHPAPPGSTTAQISSVPIADVHPPRREEEIRPSVPQDRERGRQRGGPRGQRPPERRGDSHRRRGPDQREGRPPFTRPPIAGQPPTPAPSETLSTSVDRDEELETPITRSVPATPIAAPDSETFGFERHDRAPGFSSRETEAGITEEPPETDDRHRAQSEKPDDPEHAPVVSEPSPAPATVPVKRPQYGRRNRP